MSENPQQPHPEKEAERDLWQERLAITAGIPEALETVPISASVEIEHVSTRPDGEMGVQVRGTNYDYGKASGTWQGRLSESGSDRLVIDGFTVDAQGERSELFPMYRVTGFVPGTDSGYLKPHYEIAVATDKGYVPLALVMQSYSEPVPGRIQTTGSVRVGSSVFSDSFNHLDDDAKHALKETGLYVAPDSEQQLRDVKTILELIAAKPKAEPDQPTLPLDYLAA